MIYTPEKIRDLLLREAISRHTWEQVYAKAFLQAVAAGERITTAQYSAQREAASSKAAYELAAVEVAVMRLVLDQGLPESDDASEPIDIEREADEIISELEIKAEARKLVEEADTCRQDAFVAAVVDIVREQPGISQRKIKSTLRDRGLTFTDQQIAEAVSRAIKEGYLERAYNDDGRPTGVLPWHLARCGRPTKTTGKPCRALAHGPRQVCPIHGPKFPNNVSDERVAG